MTLAKLIIRKLVELEECDNLGLSNDEVSIYAGQKAIWHPIPKSNYVILLIKLLPYNHVI